MYAPFEKPGYLTSARKVILMRADASSHIGFGHFVRSSSLGGYLSDIFECRLYSRNEDGGSPSPWMKKIADEAGISLVQLPSESKEAADMAFLEALESENSPLAVLDNYFYSTDYMVAVRNRSQALICIDDMPTRHFPADVLFSFSPLPREAFSLEPYTQYFSGFEWSFLRKPFLRRLPPRGFRRRGIVMAMGGADPLRLTRKLLPIIHEAFPGEPVEVIAGESVLLPDNVDMMPRTIIHRQLGADEIADIFDRCRLGIFPASTICMEALARKLPIAAGHFTDNQIEVYAAGVKKGYFYPLGELTRMASSDISRLRGKIESNTPLSTEFPDFKASRDKIRKILTSL